MTQKDMLASLGVLVCLLSVWRLAACEDCPCVHCGPPMCSSVCQTDCVKCCTCCVFFENRVGKRSSPPVVADYPRSDSGQRHTCLYDDQTAYTDDSANPVEKFSLRLDILHRSQDNLDELEAVPQDEGRLEKRSRIMSLLKPRRTSPVR